jgi:hypothetical protein
MGRPFRRSDYFWSAKRPRSLLEQLGVGVESDLIDKKNLGSNKPDCETDHQRAKREWFRTVDYFHG